MNLQLTGTDDCHIHCRGEARMDTRKVGAPDSGTHLAPASANHLHGQELSASIVSRPPSDGKAEHVIWGWGPRWSRKSPRPPDERLFDSHFTAVGFSSPFV